MKHVLFASILALFLFPSCQDKHTHSSGSESVALNNGQRWEANPETTSGIATMQKILDNAKEQEVNIVHLHTELDAAFQNIFRQCTMTGEAHDRLHDYLIPLKDLLAKMQDVGVGEEDTVMDELSAYLDTYKNYFETKGM